MKRPGHDSPVKKDSSKSPWKGQKESSDFKMLNLNVSKSLISSNKDPERDHNDQFYTSFAGKYDELQSSALFS